MSNDAELHRAALESLYSGDRTLFFESLADDYVCHSPGHSRIAGEFVGADGMRDHGAQVRSLSNGSFRVRLRGAMLVDAQHALVPTHVTAERPDGRQLAVDGLGLWRCANGRIAEHWEMPLDMRTFDAFWSD